MCFGRVVHADNREIARYGQATELCRSIRSSAWASFAQTTRRRRIGLCAPCGEILSCLRRGPGLCEGHQGGVVGGTGLHPRDIGVEPSHGDVCRRRQLP